MKSKFKDIHAGLSISYEQVEHEYFLFLCRLIGVGITNNYALLLTKLHHTTFVYFVPNDDNRAEDGVNLRQVFSEEFELDFAEWAHIYRNPCTVLEMMIGLSIKMGELLSDDDGVERVGKWFWEMIDNLGFSNFTDDEYHFIGGHFAVASTLELFLNRRIAPNGNGGLFPLRNPKQDQRVIEIWYQMNQYISEKYNF